MLELCLFYGQLQHFWKDTNVVIRFFILFDRRAYNYQKKKMKEDYKENIIQLNNQSKNDKIKSAVSIKNYSFDNFDKRNSNFISFSGVIDDMFLNPASLEKLETHQQHNHDPAAHLTSVNVLESPSSSNPSTPPNSYGFLDCPYRFAIVSINHALIEKIFTRAQIYLVPDIYQNSKAGLVFKDNGLEYDLKIQKKQGIQLQITGQLQNITCLYWMQSTMQWIEVKSTIKLIKQ